MRQHRSHIGLSQEELGFQSGLDRTYVGGIERGERNPSLESIMKLTRALDTTPSRLFATFETIRGGAAASIELPGFDD